MTDNKLTVWARCGEIEAARRNLERGIGDGLITVSLIPSDGSIALRAQPSEPQGVPSGMVMVQRSDARRLAEAVLDDDPASEVLSARRVLALLSAPAGNAGGESREAAIWREESELAMRDDSSRVAKTVVGFMRERVMARLANEADWPECTGTPTDCPENEGCGCCKVTPQPDSQTINPPEVDSRLIGRVDEGVVSTCPCCRAPCNVRTLLTRANHDDEFDDEIQMFEYAAPVTQSREVEALPSWADFWLARNNVEASHNYDAFLLAEQYAAEAVRSEKADLFKAINRICGDAQVGDWSQGRVIGEVSKLLAPSQEKAS